MTVISGVGGRNMLIGSGPGYRDSGETWTVFTAVRSRPATVIVFDEIEEVPAGVQRKVAEILNGRATDGMGRPTDFSQCVFALIAGPRLSQRLAQAESEAVRSDLVRLGLGRAVAERIDAVVGFKTLTADQLDGILNRVVTAKKLAVSHDAEARATLESLLESGARAQILESAGELGGNGHALLTAFRHATRDRIT